MATGYVTDAQMKTLNSVAHRLAAKGLREESRALREVLAELQRTTERTADVPASKAAEILAVTPQTVRNWVRAGLLPGRRNRTGHFLVSADAIEPALRMRQALPETRDGSISEAEIDDEIETVRAERRLTRQTMRTRQA